MTKVHILNNTIYDSDDLSALILSVQQSAISAALYLSRVKPLSTIKIRYLNKKRPARYGRGPYFAWAKYNSKTSGLELAIVRRDSVGGNALIWLAESIDSETLTLPKEVLTDIKLVIFKCFGHRWSDDTTILTFDCPLPKVRMHDKASGRKQYTLQRAITTVIDCETKLDEAKRNVAIAEQRFNLWKDRTVNRARQLAAAKESVIRAEKAAAKEK